MQGAATVLALHSHRVPLTVTAPHCVLCDSLQQRAVGVVRGFWARFVVENLVPVWGCPNGRAYDCVWCGLCCEGQRLRCVCVGHVLTFWLGRTCSDVPLLRHAVSCDKGTKACLSALCTACNTALGGCMRFCREAFLAHLACILRQSSNSQQAFRRPCLAAGCWISARLCCCTMH
jgi:hypothetical protein